MSLNDPESSITPIELEPTIKEMCYLAGDLVDDLKITLNNVFEEVITDERIPRELKLENIELHMKHLVEALKVRAIICREAGLETKPEKYTEV